jgi:hypothetical protein
MDVSGHNSQRQDLTGVRQIGYADHEHPSRTCRSVFAQRSHYPATRYDLGRTGARSTTEQSLSALQTTLNVGNGSAQLD